jgi:hypothetical protein
MKIMSPNGIGNEDFPGTTINIEIPYVENKDELVVSS